jgi:ATP-binding cassette subfamily A (ABC1) protein 3
MSEQSQLSEAECSLIVKGVYEKVNKDKALDKLQITNLVKTYGKKKAVNDLSLTVFKNEILVLLGHNGAGKTTTISMLTRLEGATSGQAIIKLGNQMINLFDDNNNLANFISVCPQENVLCNRMTVKENLQFFAKFKGIADEDHHVQKNLRLFNLESKADTLANNLSGGQKRKLQLCIALLGDSKLVLLDEPTSGMDPTARRETWDIIKQVKQEKIIILTTHYMDEAEILADRVAILS